MDKGIFEALLSRLPDMGYDPDRLNMTPQPEKEGNSS
jgi:hypothetical protein